MDKPTLTKYAGNHRLRDLHNQLKGHNEGYKNLEGMIIDINLTETLKFMSIGVSTVRFAGPAGSSKGSMS